MAGVVTEDDLSGGSPSVGEVASVNDSLQERRQARLFRAVAFFTLGAACLIFFAVLLAGIWWALFSCHAPRSVERLVFVAIVLGLVAATGLSLSLAVVKLASHGTQSAADSETTLTLPQFELAKALYTAIRQDQRP